MLKRSKEIKTATKLNLLWYPVSSKQIDSIMYCHPCRDYYYYYNKTYSSNPQPVCYGHHSKSWQYLRLLIFIM